MAKAVTLTFGKVLREMYSLGDRIYTTQEKFFDALFPAYLQFRRSLYKDENYVTSAKYAGKILNDKEPLPKRFVSYYTYNSETFDNDIKHYLSKTARTAQQVALYTERLTKMVERSRNLHTQDKEYILQKMVSQNDRERLEIMVIRLLCVTLYQPFTEGAT